MSQLLYTRRHVSLLRAALTLCVAALVLLFASISTAQNRETDLPTYEAWLREASAAARRGDRLGLEEAAARLTTTSSVRLDDGTVLAVQNSWLQEALSSPTPDLNAIAARIGAIVDALAQPPPSAPADAAARLERILSAPPFDRTPPAPPPQWLLDFLDWLVRLIESILRPIGAAPPAATNIVAWVISLGGLLLLAGIIGYLLLGLRRGIVRDARIENNVEERLTAAEALAQAGDLAHDGDYRTAVRMLYLSALLWLDERKLLRYDRALTNREYLQRARNNPILLARLAPVVETFDQVWYGHAMIDASSFATYRGQVEALRREL